MVVMAWILLIISGAGLLNIVVPFLFKRGSIHKIQSSTRKEGIQRKTQLQNQLVCFADTMEGIAKSVERTTLQRTETDELNRVFEEVSKKLCQSCEDCQSCWVDNYEQSSREVYELLERGRQQGSISKEEAPTEFFNRCHLIDKYIEEINSSLIQVKNENSVYNRMSELRIAAAQQLSLVSGYVTGLADRDSYQYSLEKSLLVKRLASLHIRIKETVINEDGSGRLCIRLKARAIHEQTISIKTLIRILEEELKRKLMFAGGERRIVGQEYSEYIFYEECNYKVLTGIARAAKSETEISGDNFSFYEMRYGSVIMMLADGMGTGQEAYLESKTVVEMMENLTEAGFSENAALKMINSTMLLKNENTTFSTLDMGIINLFSGICEFFKAGAATTFIRRKDWIETISSTSLPIGMMNENIFDITRKKLYHGDYVIMVSDGVLDCLSRVDKEKEIYELILDTESKSPQDIADCILKHVLESKHYKPIDDMTVMVAGIWKKLVI